MRLAPGTDIEVDIRGLVDRSHPPPIRTRRTVNDGLPETLEEVVRPIRALVQAQVSGKCRPIAIA